MLPQPDLFESDAMRSLGRDHPDCKVMRKYLKRSMEFLSRQCIMSRGSDKDEYAGAYKALEVVYMLTDKEDPKSVPTADLPWGKAIL